MGNQLFKIKLLKNRRGQSAFEVAIILIAIMAFLSGIANIWLWSNNQLARRQFAYNNTRQIAGTSYDGYQLVWKGNILFDGLFTSENLSEYDAIPNSPLDGRPR
jgi:hypothetical protein